MNIFELLIEITGIITLSLGVGFGLSVLFKATKRAIKKSITNTVKDIVLTYLKTLQNDTETNDEK